jgi:hypothetical protein
MKRSWFVAIKEFFSSRSKTPWAAIEFNGVQDGTVAFAMSWNNAFIQNLESVGFQGINQEETIQNFFLYIANMNAIRDDVVNPDALPNLSNESNTLRR